MTTTDISLDVSPVASPASPRVARGLATMVGSAMSAQVGAAFGTFAYPSLGVPGVVAVRQIVAAAVLVPIARPPLRRFTWAQWWPALLLALVFSVMNLSLYSAFSRIDLGLAVTLEFLGPLSLALIGSRSVLDLLGALVAAVGVYVLVLPGPATDWLGVGLALAAALCWVAYILLNRVAGQRLPGLQATATASLASAVGYLPVLIFTAVHGRLFQPAIVWALAVGVLCSALPYAADLISLRHVPTRLFGVVMSAHPVLGAVAGLIVLGQVLALHAWVGIALVVAANAVVVASSARRRTP